MLKGFRDSKGSNPELNEKRILDAINRLVKKIKRISYKNIAKEAKCAHNFYLSHPHLKELVESLEISSSIRFVGWIPHDELPKYLASSEVYVSTSLWDGGISIATLDAMACELVVVVTDVADNKKWIKDGENGFIVPTKDYELLAEKVINLLDNEEARKRFGEMNRKIVEEKQEYRREMKKMEKLYKKLIGV